MLQASVSKQEYPALQQPAALRIAAKVLSYIFHPLFIPIYVTLGLLWVQPLNALLLGYKQRVLMAVAIFMSTAFFPAISMFLLWRLRFIDNLYMRQQKERIIPFVITMFFYFWIYYVSRNLEFFPNSLRQFLMGVFLSCASALFANIYTKISMHGIAMGGLAGFAILQQSADAHWQPLWTHIAILVAGAVCTARLLLNEHRPVDVYAGFFTGVLCQVAAGTYCALRARRYLFFFGLTTIHFKPLPGNHRFYSIKKAVTHASSKEVSDSLSFLAAMQKNPATSVLCGRSPKLLFGEIIHSPKNSNYTQYYHCQYFGNGYH